MDGEVQLIYISPECILNNVKYRRMLSSEVCVKNLVALIVDEAHCVKIWGDSFRLAFAEIGTLWSLIPQHLIFLALTVTCMEITKDC